MTAPDATGWRLPHLAAWLAFAVVIALGIGGLVASIDLPPSDTTRPELTWRHDRAAAPGMATLAAGLPALTGPINTLRDAARDALIHAGAHDATALAADVAAGTVTLASVETTAADLRTLIARLPAGLDRTGLSETNQLKLAGVEDALAAVDTLDDAWRTVTVDASSSAVADAVIVIERARGALEDAAVSLGSAAP